ncbi:DUF6093 family protein [Cellulomonas denverensis]|uniref:Uncharacterized protein n=1 Tax=Cellulomonas denverensis TaxID=264297 RepID=A0A7X6KU00_9CELL|nr:DUF6093 family protein [Cellulomonas denverensis]NKY22217.1 hypothetical protein [Cellulomonas denverensis]GIG27183.1 hypothetical protein Cde04nite_34270 [Cellulomonas denverensis]
MTAASAVRSGREAARRQMIDLCQVSREDPDAPVDELTGERARMVVYAGPAKSQTYEAYEQTPEAGGHNYTVQRYAAHFPVGAFEPRVGDVIEWTACPLDPDRVGARERITAPFSKTLATAQRVFVDRMPS